LCATSSTSRPGREEKKSAGNAASPLPASLRLVSDGSRRIPS
jgi:hypothetical protein